MESRTCKKCQKQYEVSDGDLEFYKRISPTFSGKQFEIPAPSQINTQDGHVLIGDYYYADSVTDEEVERFKKYQLEAIGHADSREKFVKPGEIVAAVERSKKYKVAEHKTMPAVEGIDRFFYLFTLERIQDGKQNM